MRATTVKPPHSDDDSKNYLRFRGLMSQLQSAILAASTANIGIRHLPICILIVSFSGFFGICSAPGLFFSNG